MICLLIKKVKLYPVFSAVIILSVLTSSLFLSFKTDKHDDKIKTVLILGNSIVLHSPRAEIGWYGNWGMAASVKDSDFVHLLIRDIHKKDSTVEVRFRNIADFERNFESYQMTILDSLRNPDMLIMKISENVDD